MLKLMNWLAGWFGYEWVEDTSPYEREDDVIADEDWDDLHEHNPRYVLRKKQSAQ